MAIRTQLPETNLKTEDIKDTLIANGGNIDNDDVTSYFSAEANINMWSKHKPVILAQNFTDMDWWKSDNCGLHAAYVDKLIGLPDLIDGNMNGWYYKRPTGSSGQPLRLGDFRNYYPAAEKFAYGMTVQDKIQKGDTLSVHVDVMLDSENSITVQDFSMSDYYFGALLVPVTTGAKIAKTAKTPLADLNTTVSFDTTDLTLQDYKVYTFFSQEMLEQQEITNESIASRYYSLPLIPIKTVTVTGEPVYGPFINCEAWQTSKTSIDYIIRITGGSYGTKISGIIVKFRLKDKAYSDPLMDYVESQQILNIEGTIAADGTFTYRGTATVYGDIFNYREPYVHIKYTYGTIDKMLEPPVPVALDQSEMLRLMNLD